MYANLDQDELIPDRGSDRPPASREELLDALREASESVEVRFLSFSRAHQKEGPSKPTSRLGHVVSLEKLAGWLEESCSGSMEGDEIESLLRDLARLKGTTAAVLTQQRSRIRALDTGVLARHQMWSFLADEDGPYFESREEAITRLGLGEFATGTPEILVFYHQADDCHGPTGWDAEKNPHWRPGGKTKPLDRLDTSDGLFEVVHSPVSESALVAPIRELEDR